MNVKTPLSCLPDVPVARLCLRWLAVSLFACLTAYASDNQVFYVNDSATSNDIYCTSAGLDSNDGMSPQTPVASLQTILSRYTLGPSNIVYIDTGWYASTSNIVIDARHYGDWDRPILIKGVPRCTILNRGSSAAGAYCVENLANHIRFQGLTFTGANVGLKIDSTFCSYAEVTENAFFSNAAAGLLVHPSSATYYGQFTISRNLLYGNPYGALLEPNCYEMGDSFAVYNNTICVNGGTGIVLGGNLPSSSLRNNIITADGGGTCLECINGYTVFASDYNDLWAYNGSAVCKTTRDSTDILFTTLADWQCYTYTNFYVTCDEHSICRDPLLVNPVGLAGDYHPRSVGGRWHLTGDSATGGVWTADASLHSPCVDTADPYNNTDDLWREPAPNGGRKNMGAYGGSPQASKAKAGRGLVVMAPDLGQNMEQAQPIYWNATGLGWASNETVYVRFSLNGGINWQFVSGSQQLYSRGWFDWYRPAETFTSTTGCLIRVLSQADGSCMDTTFLRYNAPSVYEPPPSQFYVNDASTANDIFCTAAGSDTNDGLSPASPVAALQTILNRYTLAASNTVYVDTGTYLLTSNIVVDARHGGTWDGFVTFQGAGRGTILNRQSANAGDCCLVNHADFVRICDMTFTGSDTGVFIDADSCTDAEIVGNTFFDNRGFALVTEPTTNAYTYGWFTIANNLLYNNGSGMRLEPLCNMTGDSFRVINNTILVTNGPAVFIGGYIWSSEVRDNILIAKESGVCFETLFDDGLFYSDYNDLWAHDGGAVALVNVSGTSSKLSTLADWQCYSLTNFYSARDTFSFSRDPAFADIANADFHLKSFGGRWQPNTGSGTNGQWVIDTDVHSPCIDAATPTYYDLAYHTTYDLALESDPNGGRMNVGAYGGTAQASKTTPGRHLLAYAPDLGQDPQQPQPIYWNASGLGWTSNDTVHLEYSLDANANWQLITNSTQAVSNGWFDWYRPAVTFGNALGCWVRVVADEPSCTDTVFLRPQPEEAAVTPTLYYVNDNTRIGDVWCTTTGYDDNDGLSSNTPMASLQALIARYQPGVGSTIYVDAGVYVLSDDLLLPDTGSGSGPSNSWFRLIGTGTKTILYRQAIGSGSSCLRVEQDFAHIEGFVCYGAETGIVIDPTTCRNANIVRNVITSNSGFGITVLPDPQDEGYDTYEIRNNLLYNNGGGLNLQGGTGYHRAYFYVQNNTIAVYKGKGIACGGIQAGTFLFNNIISAKGNDTGFCLTVENEGALASSDYNDLYAYSGAGIASWRVGTTFRSVYVLSDWQSSSGLDALSFSRDPLFVSPTTGDYHLRSQGASWHDGDWLADTATSPCIDAGDPYQPYQNEPENNGDRINMGAYGNTSEASKSASIRILQLLSPRGGETWSGTQFIVWNASGSGWLSNDTVRIEYVGGNSTLWTTLADAASLTPTGSFAWTVPVPAGSSDSYYLRVVCNQNASVYDATKSAVIVKRLQATYYVNDASTNGDWYCTAPGSSNHSGTTPEQPLASLSDVLAHYRLGPGDTVYVDTGAYELSSNIVIDATHSGSADYPIRIVGTPSGSVLNRLPGDADRRCLVLYADYVRVEGLTCASADIGILVNASSARHVQLVGNICRQNTLTGIQIKPLGTYSGEEYQLLQNVVYNNGTGIYLQGNTSIYDSRTVFIIENNTLLNDGNGITILNENRTGKRINLLKNNLIHTTNALSSCIVTVPGALHYSDFNNLYAVSNAFVGTLQTATAGDLNYSTLSQWCVANGKQDKHSIAQDSKFVNAAVGNLRLLPNSPCVDTGVNSYWMFSTQDADGNPRVSGSTCDIGAYELNMKTSVRLFLEGPFQTGTSYMSSTLSQSQLLPLRSPYADDPRTVTRIPSNATDWVLVQFRSTTNGPTVLSRSVFLRNDGWLVNDAGDPDLKVDLLPNNAYYVVVKHRNHLAAMSAEPIAFANQSLMYDFTSGVSAYFGGADGCVSVVGDLTTYWALRAGDPDGDGRVLPVDEAIYLTQTNAAGYRRADADLDGAVTPADGTVILSNQFTASVIPRPEVVLQPILRVTPSRQTLAAGDAVTLTGIDDFGSDTTTSSAGTLTELPDRTTTSVTIDPTASPLNWGFVQNNSAGVIVPSDTVQALYTAGALTGRTDIVESWSANDTLGRAYMNVIGTQTVANAGKALIIAGRKSVDDTLWPTTDYLADNAYMTLRYRGFSKENLLYLSPDPSQDVDDNGELDDIDGEATFEETAEAFTNGVANSSDLFVYLVDHGGKSSGEGYFRLNASETVTAAQLGTWLDTLQDTYNTKVTVLLDFCYAGSFLRDLTYAGEAPRIVIAACGTNQPSYFVAGGLVSFSSAFFSGVLLGYDVEECFTLAESAMSFYQTAQLDDDKDGNYTTNDWSVATGTYIGPTFVASGDTPMIGEVCGNQVLSSETAATLWIGSVSALHPISQAWCLIVPPGYDPDPDTPVTDLPQLELAYDTASGRYSITYDGFTTPGTYNVQFYVQDSEGNVSPPRQAYIAQIGYDDRIILVAGGDTNSAAWPAVEYLTQLAYATLRLRLFDADHIYYLSPAAYQDLNGDGTNDVSATSSLANLQDALASWATTNATDRLTLYLIGEGYANTFRLNDTENLTTNALATWMADYQTTTPVPVNIILDFSGAGAFIPSLENATLAASYPDATRITLASATAGGEALFANSGTVSFSQYLLSSLIAGETLGDAYTASRRAIRRVSGSVRQRAQIDDTLNGIANEKDIDGVLAAETYLGSAFVTGADTPVIGDVIGLTALATAGTPVTLWVQNIAGMYPISNVWCVVTPPDYDGSGSLPTLELTWNASSERYETVCADFIAPGSYTLTFYAQDTVGEISDPAQSEIILPDAYEPDDTREQASFYNGIPQLHNIHMASDVDWVCFYLVTNFVYDFETYHHSESLDTVLDLYRQLPDGTLDLLDHVDEEGSDLGEYTGIDFPDSGWYWAKITSYEANTNASVGTYEFSVNIPAGDGTTSLIVLGLDDVTAAALPSNALASVSGQTNKVFNGSTAVVFSGLTNGTYLVTVPTPTNFFPREDPNIPNQVQSLTNTYYANPRRVTLSGGWFLTGFEMISAINVTSGVVRDAWTHEYLGNAQISFTAASGNLTGTVVNGSVILTSYCTNWFSSATGQIPSDIVLGACNWDVSVSLTGYEPYNGGGAVSNAPTGSKVDLGTVFLVPSDTNLNAVADAWEALYFPGGMGATEDSDHDGLNNLQEYLCGTDPTNAQSVLRFLNAPTSTGIASMTWTVVSGRSYQTLSVTSLLDYTSAVTNGPWEAGYGQETMEWTDTNAPLHRARFYRIRLNTP